MLNRRELWLRMEMSDLSFLTQEILTEIAINSNNVGNLLVVNININVPLV